MLLYGQHNSWIIAAGEDSCSWSHLFSCCDLLIFACVKHRQSLHWTVQIHFSGSFLDRIYKTCNSGLTIFLKLDQSILLYKSAQDKLNACCFRKEHNIFSLYVQLQVPRFSPAAPGYTMGIGTEKKTLLRLLEWI